MLVIASPNKHAGRRVLIRLVVIHTMEVAETGSVAEAVGNAFANPATKASAHVGVDTDSTVRYVPDSDTAWAAPGANADGLQIELAGRAGQTAAMWADPTSKAILERAAQQVATWCKTYGIQVRRLTDAQLADGRSTGIVGHDQVSRVFKRSDHWDPGLAFPWAGFLARVGAILGNTRLPIPTTVPTTPPPAVKPAPQEDTTMKPWFFRAKTGAIVIVTPTGVRGVSKEQWTVWVNLGFRVEPNMQALDPGPFAAVLASLGGLVK
jgi:hypothetical protein